MGAFRVEESPSRMKYADAFFPMPDALILATADLHDEVDTVLCADGDWPKVKGLSCAVDLLKVG
jgi:hypothetical protein